MSEEASHPVAAAQSEQAADDASEERPEEKPDRPAEDESQTEPESSGNAALAVQSEKKSAPAFEQSRTVDGVKVTVSAPKGVFPAGASLNVKKAPKEDRKAANRAVNEVRDEDQNAAVSYTFDIKVIDPITKEEIQPAEGQTVSVSFALEQVADENLTTSVYHIDDSGEAEKLDVVQEDAVTAVVETDGFSLYTIEFTYNDLKYALPGDTSVPMSEILTALGLTGEVTAVEISNTSLFSASDESGERIVTAHQSFSTNEWMKVTINDVVYEITVTGDPGAGDASGNEPTTVTDTLTASSTNNNGQYADWSGVQGASGAVYAGNSMKSTAQSTSGCLQLRAKNNSGIVTTVSGGKAVQVSVEWHESTGGALNVYGKKTAYASAADLYNSTEIGSIVSEEGSTSLTITDDYEYIGLRSASGAIYLDSISIVWDTSSIADSCAITIDPDIKNGEVTSNPDSARPGQSVTLTITPNYGYKLASLTVDGSDVTSAVQSGQYSFTMPDHEVPVTATFDTAMTWENLRDAFVDGRDVTLENDILPPENADPLEIPEGEEVTLNLNGYTIDGSNFSNDIIDIVGSLTLTDSGDSGAIIVGGDRNAVYLEGSFTMNDGAIIGSAGTTGVLVLSGATFTLSGAPVIDCGVDLEDSTVITIGGALSNVAPIGVNMEKPGVFTSGWADFMSNDAPADYFTSLKDGYEVTLSDGGEAQLTEETSAGGVEDTLTLTVTGISGSNYSSWSGKTLTSSAVYAGKNAGGNNSIQLNATTSTGAGIVTTASGGKAMKVTVAWNSNTANGKKLDVYGKNDDPYGCAADLHSSSKGTLLGTIVNDGNSTSLKISGEYEYIGLRSASGALYLDSVKITWSGDSGTPATQYAINIDSGITNGTVVPSATEAVEGDTVTLTVAPAAGYALDTLTVMQGETPVEVTNNTFTMPAGNVTVSATFALAPLSYLDADGIERECSSYTLLTGNDSITFNELDGGWYAVVGENVVYNGELNFHSDTHLILADGAHITVSDRNIGIQLPITNDRNLTIYGQTAGTGTLTARGGAYGIAAGTVTVNGGTVDGGGTCGSDIQANGGLTLNPNGTDSSFRVSGFYHDTPVTVAAGKSMTDGSGNYYIGTLTDAEKAAIAGKTLHQGPATRTVTLDASIPEGALTASPLNAVAGMTITLTGSSLYDISGVTVTDGSGQTVSLAQNGQAWSFDMPDSNVTVTATATKRERLKVSGNYNVTADTTLYGMALTGDTVINLAEGTTLTVDGGEFIFNESTLETVNSGHAIECDDVFAIDYALTIQGAGTLVLEGQSDGISVKNLTVSGGVIQDNSGDGCYASEATAVTGGSFSGEMVSGGTTTISGGAVSGRVAGSVNITGGSVSGVIDGLGYSVTITGGQVNATGIESYATTLGGTITKGSITLGCAAADDFITIGSIGECESVSIADGQTLADGAGNTYTGALSADQIAALAGKTLRACHTVAFDSDGGGDVAAQTVLKGGKAAKPADPTKEGFRFLGWYAVKDGFNYECNNEEGWILVFTDGENINTYPIAPLLNTWDTWTCTEQGTTYTAGDCLRLWNFDDDTVTQDTTLFARWQQICTVTFDSDGGGDVDAQTVLAGEKAAKPADPTKDGYRFLGWYDGDTAFDFNTAISDDVTLTAHWQKVWPVTISADAGCTVTVLADYTEENGGTPVNSGEYVDEDTVLTVTAAAKAGYTLTATPEASYTVNAATTITAASAPINYVLTLTATDGGAAPSANVSDISRVPYGTKVTVTAGTANDGYEFVGWYQTNGKRLTEAKSMSFGMFGNITYEARYQVTTGVVSWIANDNVQKTLTTTAVTQDDFPVDPTAYYGFKFTGWDKTVDEINTGLSGGGNVTVTAMFETVKQEITITIYNGDSDTPTTANVTEAMFYEVTATDVAGKTFVYWTQDDDTRSYKKTSSFWVTQNTTLRAVYATEAVEAVGTATIKTASYNLDTRKLAINAYLTVPDGAKIVKAGLVAASGANFAGGTLTATNADYAKSLAAAEGKSGNVSYTWTKTSVSPGDVWYVRAWVRYTLNGEQKEVYGDQLTLCAGEDYDASEKGSAAIVSKTYNASTKKASFNAYLSTPVNASIVKAGLVASASAQFDPISAVLTAENATYVKSLAAAVGKCGNVSYTWTKTNVNSGDTWYVRAYLVYTLNSVEHTVYGPLVAYTAP